MCLYPGPKIVYALRKGRISMKVIKSKRAFTLMEILIVVTIIGILATIAFPNFVKSKAIVQKNTCRENMLQIKNAMALWALETAAPPGTTPLKTDLVPAYLLKWPKCSAKEYEVPDIDSNPVCPAGLDGHTISES